MSDQIKAPVTLMAHLVAGYPSDSIARAAAKGLAEGNVSYFEVQFPFSDPSADGKAIQTACAEVLSRGFRVEEGFAFVFPSPRVSGNAGFHYDLWQSRLSPRNRLVCRPGGPGGRFCAHHPRSSLRRRRGTRRGMPQARSFRGSRRGPVDRRFTALLSRFSRASVRLRRPSRGYYRRDTTAIDEATLAFIRAVSGGAGVAPGAAVPKILGGFGIRTGRQSRALKRRGSRGCRGIGIRRFDRRALRRRRKGRPGAVFAQKRASFRVLFDKSCRRPYTGK